MEKSLEEIKKYVYQCAERAVQDYLNEDVTALTPSRADNYLVVFSGYSSLLHLEIGQLEKRKAMTYKEWKESGVVKSIAEFERGWKSTPDGQEWIELDASLSAMGVTMRSLLQRLRRLENEAKNIY